MLPILWHAALIASAHDGGETERPHSWREKMLFPEAGHVKSYTATAARGIRSYGCLYGHPSGTLKHTPKCTSLPYFISNPIRLLCSYFSSLFFSFNNYLSSYFFPPNFAPLCRSLHPSTSLVSRLTTCPPCLRFALSDLPPGVRMGRKTTTEALMHLP